MDSENCRETKLERIKRRYEEGKLGRIKMVRGEGYERIWGEAKPWITRIEGET